MRPTESLERKNVTELGLEPEGKPEIPWVLTEADWRIVDEGFVKVTRHQGGGDLAELAAAIVAIDRSRLHVRDMDIKKINDSLAMARVSRNTAEVLRVGGALEKITGVQQLNDEDWANIHVRFRTVNDRLLGLEIVLAAQEAALMTELGHPPEISEEHWAAIENLQTVLLRTKKIVAAVELANAIAILDPERLKISDQDWELMVARLTKAREIKKSPKTMLTMSAAMTKLAKIRRPTLTITSSIPPLPETKAY